MVAILVTIGSVSARNDPRETKGIIYEVADSVISGTFVEITQRLVLMLNWPQNTLVLQSVWIPIIEGGRH